MSILDFEQLPDDSRLWVFGTARPLTTLEEGELLAEVDTFLESWKAHGQPLTAGRLWREGRFLLVGVDERSVPPSGCSIDALIHVLKDLESRLEVRIVDNGSVFFRHEGELKRVSRPELATCVREGQLGPETVVFDQTVTRLLQYRRGDWETTAGRTWMDRAFFRRVAP